MLRRDGLLLRVGGLLLLDELGVIHFPRGDGRYDRNTRLGFQALITWAGEGERSGRSLFGGLGQGEIVGQGDLVA